MRQKSGFQSHNRREVSDNGILSFMVAVTAILSLTKMKFYDQLYINEFKLLPKAKK